MSKSNGKPLTGNGEGFFVLGDGRKECLAGRRHAPNECPWAAAFQVCETSVTLAALNSQNFHV